MSTIENRSGKSRNIFLKLRWFLFINLSIATAVSMSFCFSCFFTIAGWQEIWDDLLFSFLISSLMSGGISVIINYNNAHFPWLESTVKRFVIDFVSITLYAFIGSFLLYTLFIKFIWQSDLEEFPYGTVALRSLFPTAIALFITIFLTGRAFLFEWRDAAIATEKVKSERLKGQYQSLKDQLNPHFLFNSLNVLSNLVYEDTLAANAFIEKLSRIYRYVLDVQNEELVSLQSELDFAKSYLELQKIRFGEKLQYNIEKQSDVETYLPPLSLQLLLENALKHNRATLEEPLVITISQPADYLEVSNNSQRRIGNEIPSGIGLANITERYAFFTKKAVEIIDEGPLFIVRLPFIQKPETI